MVEFSLSPFASASAPSAKIRLCHRDKPIRVELFERHLPRDSAPLSDMQFSLEIIGECTARAQLGSHPSSNVRSLVFACKASAKAVAPSSLIPHLLTTKC